jgi:hypothetical protein
MKIIILITLFILQSCGLGKLTKAERDEKLLLQQIPLENITTDQLNSYPDLYLSDDSILQSTDYSTGMVQDSYYTGSDSTRVSLSLNFSQDYEDPDKVRVLDFQYLSRIDNSYLKYWWGLQFKSATAKYSAIADESTSDTLAGERGNNTQSFTIVGLGLGHRFRALASQFFTDRFFENVNVFGNYIVHTDGTNSEQYTGYGYTAEYGLNYRSSTRLFYGGKLSYNWAIVERANQDEEPLSARSLVFGWMTLGFELGYYF